MSQVIRKADTKARGCPGASMLFLLSGPKLHSTCLRVGDFDFLLNPQYSDIERESSLHLFRAHLG
jgi:hypothetical protein